MVDRGYAESVTKRKSVQAVLAGVGRSVVAARLRLVSSLALRLRPGAAARPPWERSILDDLAMKRPWNLVLKAARLWAHLNLWRVKAGVTVLIVSWNTRDVLADVLTAVDRFSPADTRVLVIDNGSTDGSAEMLRDRNRITARVLPSNAGHGVALDLGMYLARTDVVVTLDSDAIPLAEGWLAAAVEPVRSGHAVVAGLRSKRNFAHPVYLAVDTRAFIRRRLSFQVHWNAGVTDDNAVWGTNAFDTAELMTRRLAPDEVVLVDPSPNSAKGLPGMTAAGVVYHHGGVSRAADGSVDSKAFGSWRAACVALGLTFLAKPDADRTSG